MVSRRQMLRTVGRTVIGLSVTTGVTAARKDGEANGNESRPTTRVAPFQDQQVPTGHALEHSIGWVEDCGTEAELLQRMAEFAEKATVEATIEGIDVGDSDQYWGEPYVEDGAGYVWWTVPTGPRPPGEYDFDLTLLLTEPYTGRHSMYDCEPNPMEPGVIYSNQTVYEVVPGGSTHGQGKQTEGGE